MVVAVLLPSAVPPVTVVFGDVPGVEVALVVVVLEDVVVDVGRGGSQLGLTYDSITVSLLPSHILILPDIFIVAGGMPTPPEN